MCRALCFLANRENGIRPTRGDVRREQLPDAPATVTGKDGKVYPTSKPRKEKAVEAQMVEVRAEVAPRRRFHIGGSDDDHGQASG